MMRSLYSGVSGLKTHQTKMDVIGNNIANVNTVGFKSSKVTFSDVLYQTTQSASGANSATQVGGTNSKQIGLGSTVSSIYTDVSSSGSAQSTNNPYDLMINGDAFFIVNKGGINYFTKVGSFLEDSTGNLVTYSGEYVMGWKVDPDNDNAILKDTVSPLVIGSAENTYSAPEPTTAAYASGNIDKTDSALQTALGTQMSVSIYDKQGYGYTVKMQINQNVTDAGGNTLENKYTVKIADIYDSSNQSILYKYADDGTQSAGEFSLTGDLASGVTLEYDEATGKFTGINGNDAVNISLKPTDTTKENPFVDVSVDFSNTTMYSTSGKTTIGLSKGDTNGLNGGRKVGTLSDVSINPDGKMYGSYDNGVTKLLGQIAVATFTNPAGLEKVGTNLYQTTQNSGEFDGIGQDATSGGNSMSQGVLEMSNVDLSTEFTEMITTQRGFQANSRIITTSDTLLEELVNLKR